MELQPCGTVGAYRRHIYYREKPCSPCNEANNAYRREMYQKHKGTPFKGGCGSDYGYFNHSISGVPACDACKKAHRDAVWERRNRGTDRPNIRESVLDLLSTHGRWMTRQNIVDWITDRHPDWKPDSIERAIGRVANAGVVKTRTDPNCEIGVRYQYFYDGWVA